MCLRCDSSCACSWSFREQALDGTRWMDGWMDGWTDGWIDCTRSDDYEIVGIGWKLTLQSTTRSRAEQKREDPKVARLPTCRGECRRSDKFGGKGQRSERVVFKYSSIHLDFDGFYLVTTTRLTRLLPCFLFYSRLAFNAPTRITNDPRVRAVTCCYAQMQSQPSIVIPTQLSPMQISSKFDQSRIPANGDSR